MISMQTVVRKRIAERYTGQLNEQQTADGIAAIKANVQQLVSAAEALAASGIYSLSCAMSILAVEESQKAALLLGLLYADDSHGCLVKADQISVIEFYKPQEKVHVE